MTVDLGDLMRTRRAIRKFRPGPVPAEDVREVLEAARWAPSPANVQPARFIWVRAPSVKERLQELARESKEMSAYWDASFAPDGPSGLVNDMITPETIAVVSDPAKSLTNVNDENGFEWAAAMSIYAMWLRAHSLGYGGVFVQHWLADDAKRLLNVPRLWRFLGVFTFGHSGEAKEQTRLPFDDVVFVDRFPGAPRPR
ncbi:MAG: nitroreductase family protein [Chloroflexota bacterium]|nr:nitroreductase family protein [Chloroflexota bacterium]MDE3194104.1 nitroreductase family protein [Chloroflexota bacterium]